MNRKLTFTGGEPTINFDDLDRNNEANLAALTAAFSTFGDNYIIQGVTGTTPVTAGYIMLDGEILQVDAHAPSSTHFVKVVTYDAGGDKTFNDSTARQTWQKNRATITAGSGNLAYASAIRLSDTGLTKIVDIGDWDMNTTTKIIVAHGLSDITKIRDIKVVIQSDASGFVALLESVDLVGNGVVHGGTDGVDLTNVALIRTIGGRFDTAAYSSTPFNRGWITFDLIP